MLNNEISKRVKIALIKNDMKQSDLALELKISKQRLNNVLNGIVSSNRITEKLINWLEENE